MENAAPHEWDVLELFMILLLLWLEADIELFLSFSILYLSRELKKGLSNVIILNNSAFQVKDQLS